VAVVEASNGFIIIFETQINLELDSLLACPSPPNQVEIAPAIPIQVDITRYARHPVRKLSDLRLAADEEDSSNGCRALLKRPLQVSVGAPARTLRKILPPCVLVCDADGDARQSLIRVCREQRADVNSSKIRD
jgi:hypothetical protein